jgi:hypothetical protein
MSDSPVGRRSRGNAKSRLKSRTKSDEEDEEKNFGDSGSSSPGGGEDEAGGDEGEEEQGGGEATSTPPPEDPPVVTVNSQKTKVTLKKPLARKNMCANKPQLEATLTDDDISLVRRAMEDAFEDMLQRYKEK